MSQMRLLATEIYDGLGRFGTRVNTNNAYYGLYYNGSTGDLNGGEQVFAVTGHMT